VTNGIPLGCSLFLPVHTVNFVQTLKAVTEDNKAEYLQLFAEHRLVGGIRAQVNAFRAGLGVLFNEDLLAELRARCPPAEIQLLLCGVTEIDVDAWEASAIYEVLCFSLSERKLCTGMLLLLDHTSAR
jgi:hypothetical protein